jgi:hypothetical protein
VPTPTPAGTATEAPTDSPETTPSATAGPTSPPSTDSLPSLGPAISGRWTGLRWIAGPPSPELTEVSSDPKTEISIDFRVFGWSGGYVGFRSRQEEPLASGGRSSLSIVIETSPDGLRWTRRGVLELPDDYNYEDRPNYPLTITDVVEGPAGLLAVGRIQVPIQGSNPAAAIWTSSDGRSWRLLDLNQAFGGQPWAVDAGSVGYVATGSPYRDEPPSVWISTDGRAWLRSDVSGLGDMETRDATAFADGYVLACETTSEEAGTEMLTLTPSLWWSADGRRWSRDTLTGSTDSILPSNVLPEPDWQASLTLNRIGDHALVAIQSSDDKQTGTPAQAVWTSTDGRSWTLMPGVDLSSTRVLGNGQRAVVVPHLTDLSSGVVVEAFQDDLSLVALAQTGDRPTGHCYWTGALGPTGLVVADDTKHRFFVGLPTNE